MFSLSLPRAIFFRPRVRPSIRPSVRAGRQAGKQVGIGNSANDRPEPSKRRRRRRTVHHSGRMPDPCSRVPKRQHRHLGYFPAGEVDDDDGRAHSTVLSAVAVRSDRVEKEGKRGGREGGAGIGVFNPISFFLHFFLDRSIRRDQDCGKETALWCGRVPRNVEVCLSLM